MRARARIRKEVSSAAAYNGAVRNSRTALVAATLLVCAAAPAQLALQEPAKGRFLVAREDLRDPNFFRTVVLMLDYDEKGAMGVIVNRPTSVPLSDLLPQLEALEGRSDKVCLGGPVEPEGLILVVRSKDEPEGFVHVAGELYTGASVEGLAALLEAGAGPNRIRAYAGYSGWGPGQLDRELEQGSWIITAAAPGQVFDPSPRRLWRSLIDSAKVRFARLAGDALLN